MFTLEKMPREKKMAIRFMLMALAVIIGGFLWLWGLDHFQNITSHGKTSDIKNELHFRNF